jgi:metal-responsive CopG/Arc/MetJ family transcriptional regulator
VLRTTRAVAPVRLHPMPSLTAGNTVYTHPVAKVMISIPDELLERVDARASASGETRSGFLQRLAQRELESAEERRQAEIRRLWEEIHVEAPDDDRFEGDIVKLIRHDRETH